jgi:ferredoxin
MNVESAKLVYYSPTGTTKAVVQGIAQGFNSSNVEHVDVTRPNARERPMSTSNNELLIIGVPVYMGRVPALLKKWLTAIQAQDTPTVCVVVYGNRAYENALLELKDIVTGRGCVPVAGAAYIGEHSFSDSEAPVALGRPDEADLRHAETLGRKIRGKLQSVTSISQVSDLQVPGTRPYGGITELWDVDFIAVSDRCIQCGVCAEACPVGAVDSQDSALIDQAKCITCCACIKSCPEDARTMKPGPVQDAQQRLMTLHKEPKRPEYFL